MALLYILSVSILAQGFIRLLCAGFFSSIMALGRPIRVGTDCSGMEAPIQALRNLGQISYSWFVLLLFIFVSSWTTLLVLRRILPITDRMNRVGMSPNSPVSIFHFRMLRYSSVGLAVVRFGFAMLAEAWVLHFGLSLGFASLARALGKPARPRAWVRQIRLEACARHFDSNYIYSEKCRITLQRANKTD